MMSKCMTCELFDGETCEDYHPLKITRNAIDSYSIDKNNNECDCDYYERVDV